MTDIFIKKSKWFDFAKEHNNKVNVDATLLNGSDSYTFAAKHLAAGKTIPLSIRLDTARARGVADHFNGLRQFYESGSEPNIWIKRVADECRKFAIENSLDSDELIRNIIKLTDKRMHVTGAYRGEISQKTHIQPLDNSYVPTREEVKNILSGIVPKGKEVDEEALKSAIEFSYASEKRKLKSDWWETTKINLVEWSKKG